MSLIFLEFPLIPHNPEPILTKKQLPGIGNIFITYYMHSAAMRAYKGKHDWQPTWSPQATETLPVTPQFLLAASFWEHLAQSLNSSSWWCLNTFHSRQPLYLQAMCSVYSATSSPETEWCLTRASSPGSVVSPDSFPWLAGQFSRSQQMQGSG